MWITLLLAVACVESKTIRILEDVPDESSYSQSDPDTGTCPLGSLLDCDGACAPASRLGDGLCDAFGDVNFDCLELSWDHGDC